MILKGANAQEGSTQLFFKDVHVEQATYISGQANSRAMRVGWIESVSTHSHLKLSGEYAMDDYAPKKDVKAQAAIELLF